MLKLTQDTYNIKFCPICNSKLLTSLSFHAKKSAPKFIQPLTTISFLHYSSIKNQFIKNHDHHYDKLNKLTKSCTTYDHIFNINFFPINHNQNKIRITTGYTNNNNTYLELTNNNSNSNFLELKIINNSHVIHYSTSEYQEFQLEDLLLIQNNLNTLNLFL